MIERRQLFIAWGQCLLALPAWAQFTGPSVQGAPATVEAASSARLGTYISLRGNIVSHLGEEYFLFRDHTGEMRIEISPQTFGGQQVGPEDIVTIAGEIDGGLTGRYLWVTSLTLSD